MNIGKRIKEERERLGLSVDDVADALGKNRSTVYRYESNEIEKLPTNILEPLAKVLKTTPAYLMGWEDETNDFFTQSQSYDKIGEYIKALRLSKGISQEELGRIIGVKRAAVQKWECGTVKNLKRTTIQKLASYFDVDPANFVVEEYSSPAIAAIEMETCGLQPIKTKKFRMLGNIACGEPIFADEEYETLIEASSDIDADFCLRAHGDSMIGARIYDGDIVFIRRQDMVENGEIAAVLIDDEATLKRVQYDKEANVLMLFAENPQYKTLIFTGEELDKIKILGKAVAFQSFVK